MIAFWRRSFIQPTQTAKSAPAPPPTVAAIAAEDVAWAEKWADRERRIERAEAELARNPGFAEILAGIQQERRRDG